MAKKDKTKNSNSENTENANVNNETPETTETTTPTEEVTEAPAEQTPEVEETAVTVEETPEVEEPKKESKVEAVIPDATPKDAFLKGLYSNEGKYVLVSNGVQLCSYLNKPHIAIYDNYFELNGTRYNYAGIEVKHI